MQHSEIEQAYAQAVEFQRAGRLGEAEPLYRQILQVDPKHAPSLHMLGALASRCGQPAPAVELIRRAIALSPEVAEMHSDLGIALHYSGRLDEGIDAFRTAVELNPQGADGWNNLGNALLAAGKTQEAVDAFREVTWLVPDSAPAHTNLAGALEHAGEFDQAVAVATHAVQLDPQLPAAQYNLGNALMRVNRAPEAVSAYRRAVEIAPQYAEAWANLTAAHEEAGEIDEAIAAGETAVRLNPNLSHAYQNLGTALMQQGRLEEAIASYRRQIALLPNVAEAHSNVLFLLHFLADQTPQKIRDAHVTWARRFADPLTAAAGPHDNDRDPSRRLRIGYVSPDLRQHSIGRFMKPILANHDHDRFEIFCYSSAPRADALTEQLKSFPDQWRDAARMNDIQLAQIIRDDKIDILVDLSLQMAANRMMLFARKPAPVQATYLAYAGTSGMRAMDYRLTDRFLDDNTSLTDYTEQSIRLGSYWCYEPDASAPEIASMPEEITFGCLNSFFKVSAQAIHAWAKILQDVPRSQLILHAGEGSHRERVRDLFREHGVEVDRIEFIKQLPLAEYLATHSRTHIALDPFPYCGGTTSCDALWMGAPLITLAGDRAVARAGVSLLNQIGLPELIAKDVDEYINLATELALDRPRLESLRAGMRDRMRASPLMNSRDFMRDLEKAYRDMWEKYCSQPA